MVVETRPLALDEARAALAAEWRQANPTTPDDIAAFYRDARGIADDLEAWHQTPERQSWTDMLVHVARESGAQTVVDIGCGAGHDLLALLDTLPDIDICGVEPNHTLRDGLMRAFATRDLFPRAEVAAGAAEAPIESADLLVCVDVLEHVTDPEAFLGGIAGRAPVGCFLFEATATHDATTPLHLAENRGWHPGRVLEQHGWVLADEAQRVRVWKRLKATGRQTASLLLCAYRDLTPATHDRMQRTILSGQGHWRERVKTGDADISRSRAIITTSWWRETGDDVFLMIDADIGFTPADADHVIELCRSGLDIVCGAYPVHNGEHLALRCFPGTEGLSIGPGNPPIEVEYPATGFLAVHRRVIDALVKTVPLCHPSAPWSFYPLFPQPVVRDSETGEWVRLSEDWGFGQIARDAGFKVWLDQTVKLTHGSTIPVTVDNMALIFEASKKV
jgi:SAM-dependent methyltransferase